MTKNVYITVTGRYNDQTGETRSFPDADEVVTAVGDFYERDDGFYVFYEEAGAKNTIRLRASLLELTKRGSVNTRMALEPGRRHRTDYITPWGTLLLETDTRRMEVKLAQDKIEITAEYVLWAENASVGTRYISIIIQNYIQTG